MARPMPRPEPETRATLPSSLLSWCVLAVIGSVDQAQRDQRLAGDLAFAVLVGALQLDAHAALAVVLELLDHPAAAA